MITGKLHKPSPPALRNNYTFLWNSLYFHFNVKVIIGKNLELSWFFESVHLAYTFKSFGFIIIILETFLSSLKHFESACIMPLCTQPSDNSSLWRTETSHVLIRKPFTGWWGRSKLQMLLNTEPAISRKRKSKSVMRHFLPDLQLAND